jgi:hypothetical protein
LNWESLHRNTCAEVEQYLLLWNWRPFRYEEITYSLQENNSPVNSGQFRNNNIKIKCLSTATAYTVVSYPGMRKPSGTVMKEFFFGAGYSTNIAPTCEHTWLLQATGAIRNGVQLRPSSEARSLCGHFHGHCANMFQFQKKKSTAFGKEFWLAARFKAFRTKFLVLYKKVRMI